MKEYLKLKFTLGVGTFLIATGIALGALGAHALKSILSESQLGSYDVAVRYQIYQGFGLILMCLLESTFQLKLKITRNLLLLGTIFFSGSIYLLVFREFGFWGSLKSVIGPITPIGGILMILAYVILLIKIIRKKV